MVAFFDNIFFFIVKFKQFSLHIAVPVCTVLLVHPWVPYRTYVWYDCGSVSIRIFLEEVNSYPEFILIIDQYNLRNVLFKWSDLASFRNQSVVGTGYRYLNQCCGSGPRIRCLFDPEIRDGQKD
jgi:hypothetical protein